MAQIREERQAVRTGMVIARPTDESRPYPKPGELRKGPNGDTGDDRR